MRKNSPLPFPAFGAAILGAVVLSVLAIAQPAAAAEPPPLVLTKEVPSKAGETTLNLQSSPAAFCAVPAAGQCGSCSITCPTGKAAQCKPGLTVSGHSDNASCLSPPECSCH